MTKFVLIMFLVGVLSLTGCGGTYKYIEVEYPPLSPYAKYKAISLEVTSLEDADKEEVKSFKELIVSAFEKRGIKVIDGNESPGLIVEILNFNKDLRIARNIGTILLWTMVPAPPLDLYTSNAIEVKVSIKDKKETIEFKEFQEYKESIKNWEDLKRTVANRIADAVYFAH